MAVLTARNASPSPARLSMRSAPRFDVRSTIDMLLLLRMKSTDTEQSCVFHLLRRGCTVIPSLYLLGLLTSFLPQRIFFPAGPGVPSRDPSGLAAALRASPGSRHSPANFRRRRCRRE